MSLSELFEVLTYSKQQLIVKDQCSCILSRGEKWSVEQDCSALGSCKVSQIYLDAGTLVVYVLYLVRDVEDSSINESLGILGG